MLLGQDDTRFSYVWSAAERGGPAPQIPQAQEQLKHHGAQEGTCAATIRLSRGYELQVLIKLLERRARAWRRFRPQAEGTRVVASVSKTGDE